MISEAKKKEKKELVEKKIADKKTAVKKLPVAGPGIDGQAKTPSPPLVMEFEHAKGLEQILGVNAQAQNLGNLNFEAAYNGLIIFLQRNLKMQK